VDNASGGAYKKTGPMKISQDTEDIIENKGIHLKETVMSGAAERWISIYRMVNYGEKTKGA
jgi:hypothetical protein